MTNFTSHLLNQRGGGLRLVSAIENGRECWFIVKVDPVKFLEYRQAMNCDCINLDDYGQILDCGWGDNPPAGCIEKWIKKAA